LSVSKSLEFLKKLTLNKEEEKTVKNVLKNARERLEFLS
jgi:excinuclease UvrABC ATPase subunit